MLEAPDPGDEHTCEEPGPSGRWLAFLAEGDLIAVSITEADEVAGSVALFRDQPIGDLHWSPDGEYLAFVTNPNHSDSVLRVLRMSCGTPEIVVEADGGRPKWSRDNWIGFETTAGGHATWAAHPQHQRDPRRIVPTVEPGFYTFAPDGHRLAFNDVPGAGIYVTDVSGSGLELVSPQNAYPPRWSPDGKALSFDVEEQLFVASMDPALGWTTTAVSPAAGTLSEGAVSWSEDARWLGLSYETTPQVLELFVFPIDEGVPGAVTHPAPFADRRVQDWSFVPRSDRMVLRQRTEPDGPYDIYLVDLLGTNAPKRLNPPLLPHQAVFFAGFAMDGHQLLFLFDREVDDSFALFSVGLDAPEPSPQRLTPPLPDDRTVSRVLPAPGGEQLLYVTSSNEPSHAPPFEFAVVDLSGASPTASPLVSLGDAWTLPWLEGTWHPDARGFVHPDGEGRILYQRVVGSTLAEADVLYEGAGDGGLLGWVGWQPRP